jgi:hypothetical protein
MLGMAVMTALCTAGIAFYVRFLLALCKECPPRLIAFWARLRLNSAEGVIDEPQEQDYSLTRAA